MGNAQSVHSGQERLKKASTEVVGHDEVRVEEVKFGNKRFEELFLSGVSLDVGAWLTFDLLGQVKGQWLCVKFPQQGHCLWLLGFSWAVLVDFLVHHAR